MLKRVVCIVVISCLVGLKGKDGFATESLLCFSAEQFVVDLWEDEGPASKFPLDEANPLVLRAARAETESALLIIQALKNIASLKIKPSPLRGKRDVIAADRVMVRVIKTIPRATKYSYLVAERYEARYNPREEIPLPDILVHNEPMFEAQVKSGRTNLGDEDRTNAAITGFIPAGKFKYLLFTVSVPATAKKGEYSGRIEINTDKEKLSLPVKLIVYPFVLEQPRQKILGISNDFSRVNHPLFKASLKLLADIGINFSRVSDVLSLRSAKRYFQLFRENNFTYICQDKPPANPSQVKKIPAELNFFFYGLDEPQPKDRKRSDWSRMAKHIRRSSYIHRLGGKIKTSLPFDLARELEDRESRVYKEMEKLGLGGYYEPLDWANYGLGLQYIGRANNPNQELFSYISLLQEEFRRASWQEQGANLPSKNSCLETYYWPQGLIRYPYFARLLYGFYLFNTHLDGANAWTLYRIRGKNPFEESSAFVATLAYPGKTTLYSTYSLEAIRAGINDLRYTQQAYRAIVRLLNSANKDKRRRGEELKKRFLQLLEPYLRLTINGRRIDLVSSAPEGELRRSRQELAQIIMEAH